MYYNLYMPKKQEDIQIRFEEVQEILTFVSIEMIHWEIKNL